MLNSGEVNKCDKFFFFYAPSALSTFLCLLLKIVENFTIFYICSGAQYIYG